MAHVNATGADHRDLLFGQLVNQTVPKSGWQRRKVYKNTIRALEGLSDRQLFDIGIPRGEIRRRVYRNVYQNIPYLNGV
ncbi:DUF1127 domain-containing protein [Ruegeria sp. SCSIO 43209]|uniref:DUF1127 domain-containing protein n=1 Tax=Ruegeria sp. SCSIO 43209 TaxID=2793010 RepID=UPI00147A9E37|nr:DUF1127 domain-containing protein [Ruegeria sp. SCSIO 43209]UAB88519.1 DUF1127 domain-containing protein [Ruegeria sp. SCSIO 43209]